MNNLIKNIRNIGKMYDISKYRYLIDQYNSKYYKKWIKYNQGDYTRNVIYRDMNFEILLLCWDEYSIAKIHDHSDNGCFLKVLEGNLNEIRYDKNLKIVKNQELI